MDLSADSRTVPTHTGTGGPVLESELSLSRAHCQTEGDSTILLLLLEFKNHLHEAMEELHIRRDAETRFEDQISKLVLEKQELEWEKETLQHQSETVAKQHTESLSHVKKQAKIKSIEEEKGKYHVSAEIKDKEINNLKEELKSLQLQKYNMEKKTNELEQKLLLQSRSKDSHLNQLGEVEKRFSALSRQCAAVKHAHEQLEQNVDEAMKRNEKLTAANAKQQATIASLKKELEEVGNKLIKAKMSSVRQAKNPSPTGREQLIQQLHHKLSMETEMNKTLMAENAAVRAEKQEVMRSLQHTQQLLLSQTQTVSRVELELQTQTKQNQALKEEHKALQEQSMAVEDKLAQLAESYSASRSSWDKEKAMFLDRIKAEQQALEAVNKVYDELYQKHSELSSQVNMQAQLISDSERKDSSQCHSDCTQLFPTFMDKIRGEVILNIPISSSRSPYSGSLQILTSTLAKKPDCLEDTGALTTLAGATGAVDTPNKQESQFNQPINLTNQLICAPSSNLFGSCSGYHISNHINNSNTNDSEPNVGSSLNPTVCGEGLLISNASCLSDPSSTSSDSVSKPVHTLIKEKSDGNITLVCKDYMKGGKNIIEEHEINEELQLNREKDVKEGGAGETRGALIYQTTDIASKPEDNKSSTEDTEDIIQAEMETKDRANREETDGAEQRGESGLHLPETQTLAQTATDTTTEESDTQQVIDFMDTEPVVAPCVASDSSQNLSQNVSDEDEPSSHVNKEFEIRREVLSSVDHGPNSGIQEVVDHKDAQWFSQDQFFEKTIEKKPSDKSAACNPAESTEPQNHALICNSQSNTRASPAQSDHIVNIQESETKTHNDTNSNSCSKMKATAEICDTHVREACLLMETIVEAQTLPQIQKVLKQHHEEPRSPEQDDVHDNSRTYKREGQSNTDTSEYACKSVQQPVGKLDLLDAVTDISLGTEEHQSESGFIQERKQMDKSEDADDAEEIKIRTDFKLSSHSSDNDALAQTESRVFSKESFQASNMTCSSPFECGSTQSKAASFRTKSHVSILQQFVQGSSTSEQHTGRFLGHSSIAMPRFLKSKHNKAPLVRASELLNASSDSGAAELKSVAGAASTDTACRASLSISSFPVNGSSLMVSKQSWKTTPGCSRDPTATTGLTSESDLELSFSQEQEKQQSSIRAQISKIEQFLKTERLNLSERP